MVFLLIICQILISTDAHFLCNIEKATAAGLWSHENAFLVF